MCISYFSKKKIIIIFWLILAFCINFFKLWIKVVIYIQCENLKKKKKKMKIVIFCTSQTLENVFWRMQPKTRK